MRRKRTRRRMSVRNGGNSPVGKGGVIRELIASALPVSSSSSSE